MINLYFLGAAMMTKGKTINGLMKHIRDKHGISIDGSRQKRELMQMGYYHGYKRYRYVKKKHNRLNLSDFSEIKAIYDFDIKLKGLFYRPVIDFEILVNNYCIDVLSANKDTDFESAMNNLLTNHNRYTSGSKNYNNAYKNLLFLKNKIHGKIASAYKNSENPIAHFVNTSRNIPIWALFETLSLGDTANFIKALDVGLRTKMMKNIGIYDPIHDPSGDRITNHIYIIKDIRNSIAHDIPVFDCGFITAKIDQKISSNLENETGVKNLKFSFIIDYMVLLIYYFKNLKTAKSVLRKYINDLENMIKELEVNIYDKSSFFKIVGSDVYNKINLVKTYISK